MATKAKKITDVIGREERSCPHCHKKMEIHAVGHNKQTLAKFKTGKDVVSMACWTNNCPQKGKEVQYICT